LIITWLLSSFSQMSGCNAKKTYLIYTNFIRINKEIREVASWVASELKFDIQLELYDVDYKLLANL